jgi:signal transduction histidine kinase
MLQRDEGLNERQKKMIDEADKACVRLVAIIKELSEIGKLDDGRTALQLEGVDVFAVLREVGPQITEASDRGISLSLRGCEGRAPIRGDRTLLRETFGALLRAVLREQPDDTVVIVDCQLKPEGVLVGIGKAEQLKAAAREARAVFDDQRGGLGLSLPIARRVVDLHGGQIWSPAGADGTATARSAVFIQLPTDT